jgi:hypothetical protein
MLNANAIKKAANLIRDVRHFRTGLDDLAACPKASVTIYGGVRRGEGVCCGPVELDGQDVETVRDVVRALIQAKLAAAEAELLLLGVDPATVE